MFCFYSAELAVSLVFRFYSAELAVLASLVLVHAGPVCVFEEAFFVLATSICPTPPLGIGHGGVRSHRASYVAERTDRDGDGRQR